MTVLVKETCCIMRYPCLYGCRGWQCRYVPMFGEAQYRQERAYASAPLEEQLEAIARLVAQGKVRHFGVSNETPWGVMEFLHLCTATRALSLLCGQNNGSFGSFSGCWALATCLSSPFPAFIRLMWPLCSTHLSHVASLPPCLCHPPHFVSML